MEFNQFNNQFNNPTTVPPYPQPNFDNRVTSQQPAIVEKKDEEESFINNILKTSIGKEAVYYFSYPDSIKWRDSSYEGTLEQVGEDYIIVKEKDTNYRHVLLMLYLEWVVFKKQ